jgi:acetyltransferase-like isoleucine patch superfamily enzyme
MPAYQLDQFLPDIDPSCWIAPCATIIGNVVVGSGSSIWFGSVVRGDNEPIVIGERINIQDGCILHSDPGSPLRIGNDTTVGHRAVVHEADSPLPAWVEGDCLGHADEGANAIAAAASTQTHPAPAAPGDPG